MFEAVIFDFDGTVADTGLGVKNAIRYALNEYKMPVYEDRLDEFLGPPLYLTFENMYNISKELASDIVDTYRVYYSKKGVYEVEAYPGMLDLLADLKKAGVKLAVASSKPKHYLDVGIPYIGVDKYFDAVVGPDLKNTEPNKTQLVLKACDMLGVTPSKNIAMIGDRSFDMVGANTAGVTSVGILFGFGKEEELKENNADKIAKDIKELRDILL